MCYYLRILKRCYIRHSYTVMASIYAYSSQCLNNVETSGHIFVSCISKYILDIYLSCTGQMILPTLLYFSIVTANQNVTKCNIRLYNYNSGHPDIQIWQTIKGSTHFGDSTNVLLMKYPKYLTSAVIVKVQTTQPMASVRGLLHSATFPSARFCVT